VLRRLSLRARLLLGVVVLSAVGLLAANVVTYTSLRSFLFDRTDESLFQSHFAIERTLAHDGCPESDDGRPLPGTGPGDYVELRSSDGAVVCSRSFSKGGPAPSPPQLPGDLTVPPAGYGRDSSTFFTVSSGDAGRYRVLASSEPGGSQLLVATPLDDVDATLSRLLWVELLVTAGVLAALTALGLWVVRLGLRPLGQIEATAAAIAAGDLSRRVERAEPRTEVGRLGLALNTMLGRIESAFNAQAASERKLRRFVADASHELRTPLAAVRAYAELFSRGAESRPEDLARSMDGIRRESERMSVLVDDLLLLARLDEGRPLEREPVELDEVVGEAVETALTVEPDRPIDFRAESASVIGDRERLRQIVDNLLGNVRAHTPAGSPVTVRVERLNGSAAIEVTDSGPGLSTEDAERAFERFYRADQSRARSSGGVGLGLSIVAAVAEAHGGTVSARSEPGEGATFQITLPLADPAANGSGPDGRSTS
jgi:two-component system OmpR family sensor kinase